MEQTKDVIIENTLENIGSARYGDYLAHALCTAGRCTFTFNGQDFELREGSLLIVRKGRLLENITPTADFAVPGPEPPDKSGRQRDIPAEGRPCGPENQDMKE